MAGRYFTLPDSQYSRESQYVPLPFDRIMAAAQGKQRQYDKEKKQDVIDILGKSWNRLPGDVESSLKAKQEIDKQLQDFTGKDLLDPSIRTEWHKTKQQILNRFGPMGDIGNIQGNYDAYKAYEKDILDKSKELGWTDQQLRKHLRDAQYGFSGTINPEGGFNTFNGQGLTKRIDPNQWTSDKLKDVEAETGITGLSRHGSLNEVTDAWKHGEINHKDYTKIVDSLTKRALGDTQLLSSLEQEGRFNDQPGWSNFIKGTQVNPKTKETHFILDENNPFGSILAGTAHGGAYKRAKEDYMQVKDPLKLDKARKEKAKEGLLGTFAQSGIKDNNIFTGELSVFNGVLKVDPATGTVNVDNEALHDKLKPQGLAKWSGILPDKYFKHNDTPYKALFAISRDLGLNKDETRKEIPGNEQVLKTLTYLQNLNTSAGSNYVPVEPVRDALGTKLLNSSDKEQMVGDPGETMNSFLKDNPQFIDEKTGKTRGKLAQLTLDGNKAKVLFKFTDKEGNEVNKEFTPGNKTYQEAFNRIAKIPTETKKLILDPKSRNQEDVSEAAAALGISSGKNREYITSKLGNIQNLEPIGKVSVDRETTVYMYKDKTNPDIVKAIRYNEDKKIFTPEESTSNVVNSYMSDLFNKDEFRDVTGKINKRMETQSFETPEE